MNDCSALSVFVFHHAVNGHICHNIPHGDDDIGRWSQHEAGGNEESARVRDALLGRVRPVGGSMCLCELHPIVVSRQDDIYPRRLHGDMLLDV